MGYLSICMQPFVNHGTSEDAFNAFQFGDHAHDRAMGSQRTTSERTRSLMDRIKNSCVIAANDAGISHKTLWHDDHAHEASVIARLGLTEKLLRLIGSGRRDPRTTDNLEPLRPMSHAALVSL